MFCRCYSFSVLLAGSNPAAAGPLVRDRSVIFLFLAGGPSQYETFDPKPDGPEGSTSINGHVPTAIPGVRFARTCRNSPKLADRLTVVRSFQTKHPEHDGAHKQLMTADLTVQDGKPIHEPGLGRCTPAPRPTNPKTGFPRRALLPPTTRNGKGRAGFNGSSSRWWRAASPRTWAPTFSPFEVLCPAFRRPQRSRKEAEQQEGGSAPDPLSGCGTALAPTALDGRLRPAEADSTASTAGATPPARWAGSTTYRPRHAGCSADAALPSARPHSEAPATLKAYDTEHFRTGIATSIRSSFAPVPRSASR